MSKTFCSLFILFFFGKIAAQSYEITIKLDGLKAKKAYLGYFWGYQQFQTDSTLVDTLTGTAVFKGQRKLGEGLYFLASDKTKFVDFMVDADQNFELRGKLSALDSISVIGSDENEAFFRHKKMISPLLKKVESNQKIMDFIQNSGGNVKGLREIRQENMAIYRELNDSTIVHFNRFPQFLYSKMLKIGFNPDIPKNIEQMANGKINPAYLYYLREHYFDNTDFSDKRLLGCNVFVERMAGFFRNLFPQHPDSLALACDLILEKTSKGDPDFHRFALINLTQNFEENNWSAAANIFVHLVDKWQQKGQNSWIDAATQERLLYKADVWRPTLVGKSAPNLALPDLDGRLFDLKMLDSALTMVVFYSPLCLHCIEEMPEIYKIFDEHRKNSLAMVAVSTEANAEIWRNFVAEKKWNCIHLHDATAESETQKNWATFNLPVVYLVNRDKKIVGRRLKTAEIEPFLHQFFPHSH